MFSKETVIIVVGIVLVIGLCAWLLMSAPRVERHDHHHHNQIMPSNNNNAGSTNPSASRDLVLRDSMTTSFGAGDAGGLFDNAGGNGFNQRMAMDTMEDGKSVVAGTFANPATNFRDIAVAKYSRNGKLDASFGTGGKQIVSLGTLLGVTALTPVTPFSENNLLNQGNAYTFDVQVTRDHIYLSGLFFNASVPSGQILAVSPTAGGINYTSGSTATLVGGGGTGATVSLVIVGGAVVDYLITNRGMNYTSDPTLVFAGPGTGAAGDVIRAGDAGTPNSSFGNGFIVRLKAENGTVDSSFGTNGIVLLGLDENLGAIIAPLTNTDLNRRSAFFGSIRIHKKTGKIVVSGATQVTAYPEAYDLGEFSIRTLVVQYLPNGTLDPSFGTGGIFTFTPTGTTFTGFGHSNFGSSNNFYGLDLSDDKITLVGHARAPGNTGDAESMVLRLTSKGVLDATFNPAGTLGLNQAGVPGSVVYAIPQEQIVLQTPVKNIAMNVKVDREGRTVVLGSTTTVADPSLRFAYVMRLKKDGSLDTSFNQVGYVLIRPLNTYSQLFDDAGGSSGLGMGLDISDAGKIGICFPLQDAISQIVSMSVFMLNENGSIFSSNPSCTEVGAGNTSPYTMKFRGSELMVAGQTDNLDTGLINFFLARF